MYLFLIVKALNEDVLYRISNIIYKNILINMYIKNSFNIIIVVYLSL